MRTSYWQKITRHFPKPRLSCRRQTRGETPPRLHARLTHGPASVLGMVDRVIITDGGDMMCFEWTKQEGLSRQTKKAMQAIEAKNGVERT